MSLRYNPGFLLGEKIPAQAVLAGEVSKAGLTPGTGIEAIASDDVFDELVLSMARIVLSECGMNEDEISTAVWPLYEPKARKPTIASRFATALREQEAAPVSRIMVIVPPYTPPISSDSGYVHQNTLSAWAVKSWSETDEHNRRLFTGVSCTIYQPRHSYSSPYLLKTLGRPETISGEDNLVAKFQSYRKFIANQK